VNMVDIDVGWRGVDEHPGALVVDRGAAAGYPGIEAVDSDCNMGAAGVRHREDHPVV
jgi:hypothetical protein